MPPFDQTILIVRCCDVRGRDGVEWIRGPARENVARARVVIAVDDESRCKVLKDNLAVDRQVSVEVVG